MCAIVKVFLLQSTTKDVCIEAAKQLLIAKLCDIIGERQMEHMTITPILLLHIRYTIHNIILRCI